ncbi:GldG family protein, partial [bacterium]|nr:GldG family protein [bacterium]
MANYTKYGGIFGVFLLIVGLINYSINEFMDMPTGVLIGVGLLLIAILIFANFRKTVEVAVRRDAKYGSNAIASIVFFLGILVLINFVFNKRSHRVDLTAGNQFSLAPQTVKIVQKLDKEVTIKSFFKGGANGKKAMEDLLAEYVNHSKNIEYEFIDPDKKPAIAKKYEIKAYGTTVIECGDKVEKIATPLEQDLTNALLKVSREGRKVIYFSEGHGERDTESVEKPGYKLAKDALESQNYEIKKLFIAREMVIPADCAVLVVPGPKNEFMQAELDTIDNYINNAGKVLFLLDPKPSAGMNDYFEKWGIEVRDDVIIDISGMGRLFGAGPAMPLVNNYGEHPITKDFRGNATFYPQARSVAQIDGMPNNIEVVELVKTTKESFGETKLVEGKAKFDDGVDKKGPLAIAAAVSKRLPRTVSDAVIKDELDTKERYGRLVLFGDSDFASNAYTNMQGNMDLFLNVMGWLAEEEDLISIRPRNPEDRRLDLTAKQTKFFM